MTDRRVVPFRSWHFEWLAEAPAEGGQKISLAPTELARLERENTWTGVVDGVPLVCAGTCLQWPGRHTAWAYLGNDTGPHMHWITVETLRNLALVKGRIEATVRADFSAGQRWLKMLGFRIETPLLEKFGPLGEDHVGFVRIN